MPSFLYFVVHPVLDREVAKLAINPQVAIHVHVVAVAKGIKVVVLRRGRRQGNVAAVVVQGFG